jgi:hypothetical protein
VEPDDELDDDEELDDEELDDEELDDEEPLCEPPPLLRAACSTDPAGSEAVSTLHADAKPAAKILMRISLVTLCSLWNSNVCTSHAKCLTPYEFQCSACVHSPGSGSQRQISPIYRLFCGKATHLRARAQMSASTCFTRLP